MSGHHCHATDCKTLVPPEMFMCKFHWFRVPKPLRDRIWATYRAGQCDDMRPSTAYCEAAKAAVIAVAEKQGITPDTRLYDLLAVTQGRERVMHNDAECHCGHTMSFHDLVRQEIWCALC